MSKDDLKNFLLQESDSDSTAKPIKKTSDALEKLKRFRASQMGVEYKEDPKPEPTIAPELTQPVLVEFNPNFAPAITELTKQILNSPTSLLSDDQKFKTELNNLQLIPVGKYYLIFNTIRDELTSFNSRLQFENASGICVFLGKLGGAKVLNDLRFFLFQPNTNPDYDLIRMGAKRGLEYIGTNEARLIIEDFLKKSNNVAPIPSMPSNIASNVVPNVTPNVIPNVAQKDDSIYLKIQAEHSKKFQDQYINSDFGNLFPDILADVLFFQEEGQSKISEYFKNVLIDYLKAVAVAYFQNGRYVEVFHLLDGVNDQMAIIPSDPEKKIIRELLEDLILGTFEALNTILIPRGNTQVAKEIINEMKQIIEKYRFDAYYEQLQKIRNNLD